MYCFRTVPGTQWTQLSGNFRIFICSWLSEGGKREGSCVVQLLCRMQLHFCQLKNIIFRKSSSRYGSLWRGWKSNPERWWERKQSDCFAKELQKAWNQQILEVKENVLKSKNIKNSLPRPGNSSSLFLSFFLGPTSSIWKFLG